MKCECGHTEGQHVDMGHPRHRYTGCDVEGCSCKEYRETSGTRITHYGERGAFRAMIEVLERD